MLTVRHQIEHHRTPAYPVLGVRRCSIGRRTVNYLEYKSFFAVFSCSALFQKIGPRKIFEGNGGKEERMKVMTPSEELKSIYGNRPDLLRLIAAWEKYPEAVNLRACIVHEQRGQPVDQAASFAGMSRILASTTKLSITGFGLEPTAPRFTNALTRASAYPEAFKAQRDAMLLPGALNGFEAARAWLSSYRKTRACRVSARALKHEAANEIDYVTAGVFIAAALAEGFRVKRCNAGSDGLININQDELLAGEMQRLNRKTTTALWNERA
jgi:hypothetical protein